MQVAYFVHDLTDPAVLKRVRMLRAAGATVRIFGFRREDEAPPTLEDAPVVDLGRTYDARFVHRGLKVASQLLSAGRWSSQMADVEVVIARTPEMLVLAAAAQRLHAPGARLVYEALDIHRIMLGAGPKSRLMRALERLLLRRADLLIVSSPAFVSEYFERLQGLGRGLNLPVLLVENKVLALTGAKPARVSGPAPGRPWRIGWFGMIRCRRSLDILCGLAARRPDLIELIIAGRPARTEFDDFDGQIAATPNAAFWGPYKASDLPGLYGEVHLNWAIDYFEAGANSDWLLPNRIYEGGLHAAVPIALSQVETGRWLARHGLGLLISRPESQLEALLENLSVQDYKILRDASLAAPAAPFVVDRRDCKALLRALAGPKAA
ncbi:MAG: succinoglycan biosynthesis protein [Caulobacter sp.]|nr:succinoglycan biosynthesis protein [Caulobacter sp.]